MTNVYRAFLDLLPARPLQVGTVLSIYSEVSTIELPGGGILQARGQATAGQRVFVRDGLIEGISPSLPVEVIEV